MIAAIHSYSHHTLFGVFTEGFSALLNSINALVNRIALGVIGQIALSIPLLYLHHNLFALGFAIGFIRDKDVKDIIEKVNVVYSTQRSTLERILLFGGGGLLALLTMPTSMIFATLYYSAQWGASLYQNSLIRYKRQQLTLLPNVSPKISKLSDPKISVDDEANLTSLLNEEVAENSVNNC